jgi:hypothetical protein
LIYFHNRFAYFAAGKYETEASQFLVWENINGFSLQCVKFTIVYIIEELEEAETGKTM